MDPIRLSVFDLFKVGPGPSSSHTMGPMKAGCDFAAEAGRLDAAERARAERLDVRLFGSLSATGRGHGTDRAVLAGLMGNPPETCPGQLLDRLRLEPADTPREVRIGERTLRLSAADVAFDAVDAGGRFPYSNTLVIRLLDAGGAPVFEREYYSVGGGFVQWKGWKPPGRGEPVHRYGTAAELEAILSGADVSMHALFLENEKALTGRGEPEILDGLDFVLEAMDDSVERGLDAEGVLPGDLRVARSAAALYRNSCLMQYDAGGQAARLAAYAYAAGEENAAGHRVVTAPTCGAAGVLPAVHRFMKKRLHLSPTSLRRGLMAAAVVGYLCKHNASIAGAEVGCQGEIGVATAMAAAMMSYAMHEDPPRAAHAAAIALEHQLGLTCDPVKGYVQVPCIQRNAFGAVKAFTANVIATMEGARAFRVHLDDVIRAMAETGRDMNRKYKETSLGGLAVSVTVC